MRFIVSPAKKMRVDTDGLAPTGLPVFVERAEEIAAWISGMSYAEQKRLWACSDAIASQNAERFAHMDVRHGLTPALLAYDGIQYTYMAPSVFEDGQFEYVQGHLRILSAFYGVVRPMDGVVPYRLEMQAKGAPGKYSNMYDYWGDAIYREVVEGDGVVVNLASKEYSKVVERYLRPEDRFVTCMFGELEDGRIVQKGVYVKMARGEMVRFAATVQAKAPEDLKAFRWSGYSFDDGRSTDEVYVFVREHDC